MILDVLEIVLNLCVPGLLCLAPLTGILYRISLFLLHSSEILFAFCRLSLASQEEVSEKASVISRAFFFYVEKAKSFHSDTVSLLITIVRSCLHKWEESLKDATQTVFLSVQCFQYFFIKAE